MSLELWSHSLRGDDVLAAPRGYVFTAASLEAEIWLFS